MAVTLDVLIVGGGAAGFFSAINLAQFAPHLSIAICERGSEVLTKVKISGGGRCNVTHAQFIPKDLTKNYPRGEKELLGPFHTFMTGDTIAWFENRGVSLKIEEDGRMFPTSNTSQSIIDCFINEAEKYKVRLYKNESVKQIEKEGEHFKITTTKNNYQAKKLIIATGSNPKIWELLKLLGHTIIDPVSSLFTFNINDERLKNLQGISTHTKIEILSDKGKTLLTSSGPLLITHWGVSGPAVLKLSAWGARLLAPLNYHFLIRINWLEEETNEETLQNLILLKHQYPKQTLYKYTQFNLPKRLWQNLLKASGIDETEVWATITKTKLQNLAFQLTHSQFEVLGKSTFKEEFVTAGGVDLKEVNFKTFESKLIPNLFFAGEVLNIDAITGGFNFQNAWTGGYMVAKSIAENK